MSDLKTEIENLYSIFSQYSTAGIHHCDCGCIPQEAVTKLHSKPLRQLTEDDLVHYHGSALYTWGDVEHYKHFLPRYFELFATKKGHPLVIDLRELSNKLEYAAWNEWPEKEVQAIKDFVLAEWTEFICNKTEDFGDIYLDSYAGFLDIELLLQVWNITGSENALKNFVLFFYYNCNSILDQRYIVNEKNAGQLLKSLIYTPGLTERLQSAFFEQETIDKEYSEKISIVLQMIEAQMKVDGKAGKSL